MLNAITNLAKRLFGDSNERELKKFDPLVEKINSLEPSMQALSDEQLSNQTVLFRERLEKGETLDDLLPEAFATVREAAVRKMGMRPYNCQLIGGICLHQGQIAEMRTGEGKTLTGTLAVYLNAISGKGVHVVTVNDYLAKRDAEWMEPIYNFLGLTVGSILSNERSDEIKRAAYVADITYGTNNEFGFDYLRDNMKFDASRFVQRGHNFAIIDEVDSILIDEARTPLIISGPMNAPVDLYRICDAVIPMLQEDLEFVIDEKGRTATLTDEGIGRVEEKLAIDNLYDPQNMEVLHHISQSLKAHYLFKRDRDYVVRDGKVTIVDEFTGRLMDGRRWSDGLHQAVEAKEKLNIEQESQTYATITFQNLFRMYDKLAGMTGTAATEAAEFADIYDLNTLVIPTNRPIARKDSDDVIYKTQMEKFQAAMHEIVDCHSRGQPVLVGTTSVEKSEILSQLLRRKGTPHEVLNAKNHSREATIVAQAGRLGGITISTNMAGRGTDIKLGGNPEEMATHVANPETDPEGYAAAVAQFTEQCNAEREQVLAAGGLHIIGTERHESRRVDNQLRGRAGRQGDPGSSRFYLSLEDDLMRIFGSDKITLWMERMGLQDDEPIEHRWITRAVENAQVKVEGFHFNSRKNLLEYDDVMNYQRKGVYELRRRALAGENIQEMIDEAASGVIEDIMDDYIAEGLHPEHWNVDGMRENMERALSIAFDETDEELRDLSRNELRDLLLTKGNGELNGVKDRMGEDVYHDFARMLLLQFTDDLWKDHLLALDRLRQGVGLRGYGQRNPLLEYKREALQMYRMMNAMRDERLLTNLVHAQDEVANAASGARNQKATARRLAESNFQVPEEKAPSLLDQLPLEQPVFNQAPPATPAKGVDAKRFGLEMGVRRNDPCPCGSGLKFKKCCYSVELPEGEVAAQPLAVPAEPTPTGPDPRDIEVRVNQAFNAIHSGGVRVLINAGPTDAEAVAVAGDQPEDPNFWGFVFTTTPDMERASAQGVLSMGFGSSDPDRVVDAGRAVCDAFVDAGFEVQWDETSTSRPLVVLVPRAAQPDVPDLFEGFDLSKPPEKGPDAKRLAILMGASGNDPCLCGSEQKYKKCCKKEELPEGEEAELVAKFEAARAALEAAEAESMANEAEMAAAEGVAADEAAVEAADAPTEEPAPGSVSDPAPVAPESVVGQVAQQAVAALNEEQPDRS